jgi:dihydrofolate reductase
MKTPEFSLIVATDKQRAIGRNNQLLWSSMPSDMRHFREVTADKVVLMGRKTAESIGRALPKRVNLVLTRAEQAPYPGQTVVTSIEQARALAGDKPLICLGGEQVYRLCLPFVDRIYLTKVQASYPDADAHFPALDAREWTLISERWPLQDVKDEHGCSFVEYVRRRP